MPEAGRHNSILLRARWVLPIAAPPIRDGAVLVRGDRIIAVGKISDLSDRNASVRLYFPDGILTPGLVNPHTHLENTRFVNSIKRPQPFNKWLFQMVRLVRSQSLEDALAAAGDGVKQLVKYGVTCVGEFSRLGASFIALREAKMRGIVFKELICLNDKETEKRLEELSGWIESARSQVSSLLSVAVGPHAPYTVTPLAFRRVLELAEKRNLLLCTHAAESHSERKFVERREGIWRWWLGGVLRDAPLGLSPIRYLDWLGILQPNTLLVHCVQVDETDISVLRERKVWVVHCPRSNANLKVGTMPLAKMLSAGVRVCLATDGLASVDSLSPLDEIRFAIELAQEHPKIYPSLSPDRWLRMVTLDSAAALGLDKFVGSLERGKQADIAVFRAGSQAEDPFEALLFGAREATLTMVAGKVIGGEVEVT
ncbi:MAG: amidohydrolase family protein [Armatimonadetes bacterium]|nr:amidohydrolase family protein [Armatimonadota bacterium]